MQVHAAPPQLQPRLAAFAPCAFLPILSCTQLLRLKQQLQRVARLALLPLPFSGEGGGVRGAAGGRLALRGVVAERLTPWFMIDTMVYD
jgi:hypothetical protein